MFSVLDRIKSFIVHYDLTREINEVHCMGYALADCAHLTDKNAVNFRKKKYSNVYISIKRINNKNNKINKRNWSGYE